MNRRGFFGRIGTLIAAAFAAKIVSRRLPAWIYQMNEITLDECRSMYPLQLRRYNSLAEAMAAVREGDVITIDEDGQVWA